MGNCARTRGSEFHRSMFLRNLDIPSEHRARAIRSGQPHIQTMQAGQGYFGPGGREKTILFPHRLNADKQPEIFKDLTSYLPSDCPRPSNQRVLQQNWTTTRHRGSALRFQHVRFQTETLPGALGPARAARRQVDLCCIAVYMKTRGDWFAVPAASPPAQAPVAASREARSCPPKTGRCLRTCRCIGPN